jgi:hypothetical protein
MNALQRNAMPADAFLANDSQEHHRRPATGHARGQGTPPDQRSGRRDVRESRNVRETVHTGFAKIQTALDGMLVDKPKRAYHLDDAE